MQLLPYQRFAVWTPLAIPELLAALRCNSRARGTALWSLYPDPPLRRLRLDRAGFCLAMRVRRLGYEELLALGRFTECEQGTLVSVSMRFPWPLAVFPLLWSAVVLVAPALVAGPAGLVFGLALFCQGWLLAMLAFCRTARRLQEELTSILVDG